MQLPRNIKNVFGPSDIWPRISDRRLSGRWSKRICEGPYQDFIHDLHNWILHSELDRIWPGLFHRICIIYRITNSSMKIIHCVRGHPGEHIPLRAYDDFIIPASACLFNFFCKRHVSWKSWKLMYTRDNGILSPRVNQSSIEPNGHTRLFVPVRFRSRSLINYYTYLRYTDFRSLFVHSDCLAHPLSSTIVLRMGSQSIHSKL